MLSLYCRRSLVTVGFLLAYATPALGQEPACLAEKVATDRPRVTARVPISEIQDDLQNMLASGASKVLKKLDPISFSSTTGAIRVSGTLIVPTGMLLAKAKATPPEGASATDAFDFNITFRPSVVNKCGSSYVALEFLRVSLEQNDLLGFFPVVQNLVEAVLDDDAVRTYVATFLAKPFGLAPDSVGELLDRKNVEVDSAKKIIRLRLDFTVLATALRNSKRVNDTTKRVIANPAIAREIGDLRLWGFGPDITRSTGDDGPGYEPGFLLELGRGVPNAELQAFMDKRQGSDREFVKQAMAADLAKYGNPATLLQVRDQLIASARAKLVGKGPSLGPLEQRQITALSNELDAEIRAGVKADNPLFYGDPEGQARDLTASMTTKVQALFDQLGRDREMSAIVAAEASQLRSKERPFVEQRTSEQTIQQFVHFGDGVAYKGEPVFRDLQVRLNPVMNEVTFKGLLHMNIPAWTAGYVDPKLAKGISGVLGNYLPFRVQGKLMFTPQGELLFNLQALSLDLPGKSDPWVLTRGTVIGHDLFDAVELLLADVVVPKVMGVSPSQKLVLDTLKSTKPVKRGDMIVLNLDVSKTPLYNFVPDVVKDLRLWRVGMHDSLSVGRRFFELAAGAGPVSQSYWQEQDKRQAEAISRLQAKDAGHGAIAPKDVPIDMQLRVAIPELKRRIDLMLRNVKKVSEGFLEANRKSNKFGIAVVPDPLTVDFPLPAEVDQVANKLLEHARKRDPNARKETLTDIFKLSMKAKGYATHIPFLSKLLTLFRQSDEYEFELEATLYLKLSLIPIEQFTGEFNRKPLFLGEQVFEIELVYGSAKITKGKLAKLVGWGADKKYNIDDADFDDPKSAKLKSLILGFVFPHIDNESGSYLIPKSGSGKDAQFFHLNSFVRFFSTEDRFALQLNPRLFSPYIDLQVAHPVDPKPGEKELLFDGKKIGLRIENAPEVSQVALDCAMRPTLAGVDEAAFAQIVKDSADLLLPMSAATTGADFLKSLKTADLAESFLKPLRGDSEYDDRSIVARLNRLTLTYPYLSRHGNNALLEAPEGLGTGMDTVTYAKTLIQIEKQIDAVIATAQRLGVTQQALADPGYRAFVERHLGKRGDGSDGILKNRVEPLLATYRDKFLERNKAVLASPANSDWTERFRVEAQKAQAIYNEISR